MVTTVTHDGHELVGRVERQLARLHELGDHADHVAARALRRARHRAHQAGLAAAVNEAPAPGDELAAEFLRRGDILRVEAVARGAIDAEELLHAAV
jgi:hypothetical protein